ncbi:MAG: cytochrome c [Desulfobulbaceae bacterium]|uniref:Cytochrome c n=1 Tax=Candidatus Desulfobia pelagia TaxID=2841692 RepID=A0A8J6NIF4_9BACT|nr:cytochrome c [Candidatus Desulfobia pelagia]
MKATQALSFLILIWLIIANNCLAGNSEITKGEKVYQEYCNDCHGIKGIGEDPKNPNGGFNSENEFVAPALNGTAHTWHHHPVFLFEQIKNRKVNKSSPMPPFSDILNDEEIHAVIAYIKSLWPENIRKSYDERFKE